MLAAIAGPFVSTLDKGLVVASCFVCVALVVPGLWCTMLARSLLARLTAAALLAMGTLGPWHTVGAGISARYFEPSAAAGEDPWLWTVPSVLVVCVIVMGVALVIAFIISTFVLLQE
jgi:hypothetical protein